LAFKSNTISFSYQEFNKEKIKLFQFFQITQHQLNTL
jgi:hypothetical protein